MKLRIAAMVMLIFAFSLATYGMAAQPVVDTANPSKPYKLSKRGFLAQYGRDDSSRALIRYHFRLRNGSLNRTIPYTAVGGISAFILLFNPPSSGLGGLLIGIPLLMASYVCAAIVLVLALQYVLHSRKKLYRVLQDYKIGKPLPRKTVRRKLFKQWLRKEQNAG